MPEPPAGRLALGAASTSDDPIPDRHDPLTRAGGDHGPAVGATESRP